MSVLFRPSKASFGAKSGPSGAGLQTHACGPPFGVYRPSRCLVHLLLPNVAGEPSPRSGQQRQLQRASICCAVAAVQQSSLNCSLACWRPGGILGAPAALRLVLCGQDTVPVPLLDQAFAQRSHNLQEEAVAAFSSARATVELGYNLARTVATPSSTPGKVRPGRPYASTIIEAG